MVKLGCTADGILNEAKFSEPLSLIGISGLHCCDAKDLIHGFRFRKLWFPSNSSASMPRYCHICIQLGTGVIYHYWKEHVVVMFLMLVLLLILSFYETEKALDKKLRHNRMKLWMMAHTCSPQFVMGRSVTCTAAGALCLISALTLAEPMLRSYLMPWSFKFCNGKSDYKWSTTLVLITQTIAIGIGTIAPAIRWFTAVNFRCPSRTKKRSERELKVETYWIQFLVEMKECPFTIHIRNQHCRKVAHEAKIRILDLCIGIQIGIVLASKVIGLISVYFVGHILLFCDYFKKLIKFKANSDPGSESQPSSKMDLSRFVLHLEGETELVELMMMKNCDATNHWIQKGKKKQPKFLLQLLEKSSSGLCGVREFDSDLIHSLDIDEPPNCWSLPVVTLTAIAMAIPNISSCSRKQLIRGVHEGLIYVRNIEDNLDAGGDMTNNRKAAYSIWQGVDLYQKWLDMDLNKLSLQAGSEKEILKGLSDAAEHRYVEFKMTYMNQCQKECPSNWPVKVLAANSMYRISKTVLQNYERSKSQNSEILFELVSIIISDILGACLTNLPEIIYQKCVNSSVELREESVRHAAFLLGETEKILKLLNQKALPNFGPDEVASIDDWRSLYKLKNHLTLPLSSTDNDAASPISCDLHLIIQ